MQGALDKDRSRRYETANGLAADLRRYLGGRTGIGSTAEHILSVAENRAPSLGGGGGRIS